MYLHMCVCVCLSVYLYLCLCLSVPFCRSLSMLFFLRECRGTDFRKEQEC